MLTEDSKIEFHELRYGLTADEHNLFGVVRWDTDDSLKIDKDAVAIIQLLRHGKTVKETAKIIRFSPPIVLAVLKILEKANFFKSIDGIPVKDNSEKIKPWLTKAPRKLFKWILYKPFEISILTFSIFGIVLGLFMNGIPSYKAFFWTSDIFIVFVSLSFVGIILTLLHESCHFIATKAVGGEALMRVSYRYVYLVAETESYHLAIVPKKLRYKVYFAGPIFDLFIVALLYWYIAFTKMLNLHIGVLYNFLIAIILLELVGIIWEFNVFLETDMYNFLSEYLKIENLRNDALKFIDEHTGKGKKILLSPIKYLLRFIPSNFVEESDDLRLLSKNDKEKLYVYIVILIVGIFFVTLQYIFYSIPRDFTFFYLGLKGAVEALRTFNVILFLKSGIIVLLVTYDYFLIFYLRFRRNRKNIIKGRKSF